MTKNIVIIAIFFISQGIVLAEIKYDNKNRIHIFTGKYTTGSMGDSSNFVQVDYENNFLAALAYSRDIKEIFFNIRVGPEIGAATRFGEQSAHELWGGIFFRHCGFHIKNLKVSLGVTGGLSLVDKPIGKEKQRSEGVDRKSEILFYLGPEFSFSLEKCPNIELVYRLHHRSGADGTLGGLKEGHNANTLGIRYRF